MSALISTEARIEGLRNLRTGYDLVAAVGFWKQLHGEDLIEEYAALAAALSAVEAEVREAHNTVSLLETDLRRKDEALREIVAGAPGTELSRDETAEWIHETARQALVPAHVLDVLQVRRSRDRVSGRARLRIMRPTRCSGLEGHERRGHPHAEGTSDGDRPRDEAAVVSALVGETQGRPGNDTTRVPIHIDEAVRTRLRDLLYLPQMRGVGYSEFIDRAVAAAIEEIEQTAPDDA